MPVIDPPGNRHQLDNIDAEMLEMVDDIARGHPRQRSPQRSLHRRMAHGEGADVEFVNEIGPCGIGLEVGFDNRPLHQCLGHQGRGIDRFIARQPQFRAAHERPVDAPCVRVDQELVGIEIIALRRIVFSIGPQAVAGVCPDPIDMNRPAIAIAPAHLDPVCLLVLIVEQAHPDRFGGLRINPEIHTGIGHRRTERGG